MRYLGWILALLFAAAGVAGYFIFYATLERGYAEQAEEIKMWTAKVAVMQEGKPIDTSSADTALTDTASTRPQEFTYGNLIATIPSDDLFSSSKPGELSAKGKGELDKLLPVLKTSQGDVAIMVHTDNVRVGSSLRDRYPTNWELTALRAAVIARYLLERGIDYKRLVPCGISAARPLASNSTSEGRAKNRRVEIYLR
ncbi:OmpA family protein [candidate division WOR-3 bacterium]|nr:OmpA family protein [candidate division WOR-3 bacterium]